MTTGNPNSKKPKEPKYTPKYDKQLSAVEKARYLWENFYDTAPDPWNILSIIKKIKSDTLHKLYDLMVDENFDEVEEKLNKHLDSKNVTYK